MSLGLVFWILMLLWLVFGLGRQWYPRIAPAGDVLLFILLLLLGWAAFGAPIKG